MEPQRREYRIVFSSGQHSPSRPPTRFGRVKAVLAGLLLASFFIAFLITAVVVGSLLAVVIVAVVGIVAIIVFFAVVVRSARR